MTFLCIAFPEKLKTQSKPLSPRVGGTLFYNPGQLCHDIVMLYYQYISVHNSSLPDQLATIFIFTF